MFDTPIDDALPGEITTCGWPWHGRLDYTLGSYQPTLTLPNGTQAPLSWFPNSVTRYDWHQHGTLLKFRDPRAPDVVRTPEQLEADAERGVTWRADVLFGPREGLVYGTGPSPRQPRSWLYHDGSANWRVSVLAAQQIRLSQLLFVIGRQRRANERDIVVSRPAGAPALTDLVVIDALPDGSRVLLARYRAADIPWGVNSSEFVQAQLGAWCAMPYDLWELRITHNVDLGTYAGELVSVRDAVAVAGEYVESPFISTAPVVTIGTEITGITSDDRFEYAAAETTWSVTDQTGQLEGTLSTRSGTRSSVGHRTVGAYYGSDGAIGFWTVAYGGLSEVTGDPSITFDGASAWSARRPLSSTRYGVFGSSTVRFTTTNTLVAHNSAWMELRRDGETVSRAATREDVTWNVVDVWDRHFILSWETGVWYVSSWLDAVPGSLSRARVQECSIDGQVVIPPGSASLHPDWTVGGPPLVILNAGTRFFSFPRAGRITLSAFRYCAQLPVLAVTVRDADSGAYRQVLGNTASPDGHIRASSTERIPPFAGLYGSWNPVTGEILRDVKNPVCYI